MARYSRNAFEVGDRVLSRGTNVAWQTLKGTTLGLVTAVLMGIHRLQKGVLTQVSRKGSYVERQRSVEIFPISEGEDANLRRRSL